MTSVNWPFSWGESQLVKRKLGLSAVAAFCCFSIAVHEQSNRAGRPFGSNDRWRVPTSGTAGTMFWGVAERPNNVPEDTTSSHQRGCRRCGISRTSRGNPDQCCRSSTSAPSGTCHSAAHRSGAPAGRSADRLAALCRRRRRPHESRTSPWGTSGWNGFHPKLIQPAWGGQCRRRPIARAGSSKTPRICKIPLGPASSAHASAGSSRRAVSSQVPTSWGRNRCQGLSSNPRGSMAPLRAGWTTSRALAAWDGNSWHRRPPFLFKGI